MNPDGNDHRSSAGNFPSPKVTRRTERCAGLLIRVHPWFNFGVRVEHFSSLSSPKLLAPVFGSGAPSRSSRNSRLSMNRDLGRKILGRKIRAEIFLSLIFLPFAASSRA